MSQHSEHESDRGAAYRGLILGAIVLGALLYTVSHLTQEHYKNAKGSVGVVPTAMTWSTVALDA